MDNAAAQVQSELRVTEDPGVEPESASPVPATTQSAPSPVSPSTSTKSLKRTADMMEDDEERQDNKRKRVESENGDRPEASTSRNAVATDGTDTNQPLEDNGTASDKLVEDMGLELSCGCCAALCYNPVIVLPCQHYFCGSCYTLWTQNGGINCPSCRSAVRSIVPSRAIQALIEVYLRCVPSRARAQREMEQADEVYTAGQSIRVPTPRPRSPEIAPITDNDAYFRPCPHCPSPNDFNWSCPDPIIDPAVDLNRARLLTSGVPPGHARCGSCEHLHATRAPNTSKCDFCLQTFCGLVVPTRCHAKRVREQRPLRMDSLMDILGDPDVYDAFNINAVEFDYLLDYLREHEVNPPNIYSEIIEHILTSPGGWRPLLDKGIWPELTERATITPPTNNETPASAPVVTQQTSEQQPDSSAQSPETIVEISASETQAQAPTEQNSTDHEMRGEINTVEPIRSPVVPGSEVTESNAMNMDSSLVNNPEGDHRPATPLIVPERFPSPPAMEPPEPTLDALPVDVQHGQEEQPAQSETTGLQTEQSAVELSQQATEPPPPTSQSTTTPAPPTRESGDSSDSESEDGGNEEDNSERSSPPEMHTPPAPNGLHLNKICRSCAAEVFFWGARDWWIRERAKAAAAGDLPESVRNRKDCESLGSCDRENDNAHAREFNHVPHPPTPVAGTSTAADMNTAAETSQPSGSNPTALDTSAGGTDLVEPSPEQPSNPSSPLQGRMEIDPPTNAPQEPSSSDTPDVMSNTGTSNETSTVVASIVTNVDNVLNQTPNAGPENDTAMDHDHESSNASTLESPNVSHASTSGEPPVNGTTLTDITESSINMKLDPGLLLPHGDVQMVTHDESDLTPTMPTLATQS